MGEKLVLQLTSCPLSRASVKLIPMTPRSGPGQVYVVMAVEYL